MKTRALVATKIGAIHVESTGTGPPALLLHGVGSDHTAFDAQVDAFAQEFRLLTWDAPGYGRSTDPPTVPSLEDFAAAAACVLQSLDAVPAHVVGASWGGVIATRLALDHPRMIRTLALIGSTVGRARNDVAKLDIVRRVAVLERDGVAQWARQRVSRLLPPAAPDHLCDRVRQSMTASVRLPGYAYATASLAATDHKDRLPELSAPTLVIAGAEDHITGVSEARTLAAGIPGAEMTVVTSAGHLTNQEQPAAVNAALRRLWKSKETT